MKSKIPLCFYPTQVVFVDDNPDFLKSIGLAFSKQFSIKLFEDTQAALDYINSIPSSIEANTKEDVRPEGDSDVWVKRVLTQPQNKRFGQYNMQETSVVIIDYSMPQMNGIEFCEKISNPAIKKILLTGFATTSEAVKAFNNNVINYYIKKNDDDMLEELQKSIQQLQHAYFNDLSHSIKTDAIDSTTPFFSDTVLANYFESLCESLSVAEYYFLSGPSRFLLNLKDGNKIVWVLYTEEDYEEHLQVMVEEQAPKQIIDALKNKKSVPYFKTADGYFDSSISNPSAHLFPATCIEGKVNYYCGLVEDLPETPQQSRVIAPAGGLH